MSTKLNYYSVRLKKSIVSLRTKIKNFYLKFLLTSKRQILLFYQCRQRVFQKFLVQPNLCYKHHFGLQLPEVSMLREGSHLQNFKKN